MKGHKLDDHIATQIATEVPLALTYNKRYNKRPHVVMMVTSADLENSATGYRLSSG